MHLQDMSLQAVLFLRIVSELATQDNVYVDADKHFTQ